MHAPNCAVPDKEPVHARKVLLLEPRLFPLARRPLTPLHVLVLAFRLRSAHMALQGSKSFPVPLPAKKQAAATMPVLSCGNAILSIMLPVCLVFSSTFLWRSVCQRRTLY